MTDTETTTVVVRELLDPTPDQLVVLQRYATASRCCFNFAFGLKHAAQQRWARGRDRLIAQGMEPAGAAKAAPKAAMPSQFDLQRIFLAVRDRPLIGPRLEGQGPQYRYTWWKGVNATVCQQAFRDADTAWANWLSARRRGTTVGYPRPKRAGRCRDSFRMTSVRLVSSDLRHVRIGGEKDPQGQRAFTVRLHRPAYRLARLLARGGQAKMVTIARDGHRWFAAFSVRIPAPASARPSRRQVQNGTVGVDLGVEVFAATSSPLVLGEDKTQLIANPRHLDNARRALTKWQRRMARRHVKGRPAHAQSQGWQEAREKVARLHGLVAAHRASTQHLLTKRLVTQYAHIAIEDLHVKNMTKSARGTTETPGKNVAAKAGLNRAMLDVGFGEIRRQIEYKARLYGARVTAVDPAYTSQTCHQCGQVDRKSRRTRSLFHCTDAGTPPTPTSAPPSTSKTAPRTHPAEGSCRWPPGISGPVRRLNTVGEQAQSIARRHHADRPSVVSCAASSEEIWSSRAVHWARSWS
ncbi:RNA-guided endonuclease InsQ/TnpB family protein [Streptomyces sp. NPDC053560]|uniref:RNA-guided endonuclease InsQ/TnpB family protein n=1 Tax=Streptomyces sp. NPDC053560 TaxID=3365711 RepID=UPI0037D7D3D8